MNSPAFVDSVITTHLPPRWAPAPPPQGMDARQTAEWWSGLSLGEQQGYQLFAGPDLGKMDGLPAEVRHAGNMQTLHKDADRGGGEVAYALMDRINDSWSNPDVENLYLMSYQPATPDSDALVVVSIGNPDTADNVGIYVPGTGADLDGVAGGLDRAGDLRAAAEMVPGSGDTATVYWLGYDAPDNLLAAAQPSHARDGAESLRDFTDGLREASTNLDARVTVIGHSYGSTLIGHADSISGRGLDVNDVVVLGSPGMGTNTIDGLHIKGDHFWAGMADNDSIRNTPDFIHGPLPVSAGFGGTRINTGDASGHSGYWVPGGESIRNQAYIMTGNYNLVTDTGHL